MNRIKEILLKCLRTLKDAILSWDALAFVCFALVATVLWYGHAIGTERETTLHIPVSYDGVPQDVYFEPELPDHIDVVIRDAGRRLIEQHEDIPVLEFDLSDQIKDGAGKVHIASEQIYQKLPSAMQGSGTAKLVRITPGEIEGNYRERYTERKYTMNVETRKVPAGHRLILFPPRIDVTVRMSQSHYNDVSAKDITVFCEYPANGEDKLEVKSIHRSKFIKGIRLSPAELEYIIEKSQ